MESLVCTVKNAFLEGDKTRCSVFMLSQPSDFVGTVLTQHKDGVKVGSWRVESYEKDLVLVRIEGDLELEQCDYMFGQITVSEPPPPSQSRFGHHLVFEGKNWKLASEKKWREKLVNIASFEHVGDVILKGKPCKVMKGPDYFVAVRVEEST